MHAATAGIRSWTGQIKNWASAAVAESSIKYGEKAKVKKQGPTKPVTYDEFLQRYGERHDAPISGDEVDDSESDYTDSEDDDDDNEEEESEEESDGHRPARDFYEQDSDSDGDRYNSLLGGAKESGSWRSSRGNGMFEASSSASGNVRLLSWGGAHTVTPLFSLPHCAATRTTRSNSNRS